MHYFAKVCNTCFTMLEMFDSYIFHVTFAIETFHHLLLIPMENVSPSLCSLKFFDSFRCDITDFGLEFVLQRYCMKLYLLSIILRAILIPFDNENVFSTIFVCNISKMLLVRRNFNISLVRPPQNLLTHDSF